MPAADAIRDVLELTIAKHRHAPNPVFVRAIIGDLNAAGLVIVGKDEIEGLIFASVATI